MQKIFKITLIFGVLAGVACFLFFLLAKFTVENPLSHKLAPLGLQMILISYGIWYYKRSNAGYLHFYEGFTIAVLGNILAALTGGLLIWLFLVGIDIEPFNVWIRESVAFLISDRENKKEVLSEEAFARMLEAVKNSRPYTVIPDRLITTFWAVFPMGLLVMALRKIKPV